MATLAAPVATTMSGAQFDALSYEEGRRWELVCGELIAVPSPTLLHQEVVSRVLVALRQHVGTVKGLSVPDVEFALSEDDRVRPDVCAILGENAARIDFNRIPIPGAPDIAVEVISPSERTWESYEKVRNYPQKGVREVWRIYPQSAGVEIHRGGNSRFLERGDKITSDLLPGFELPIESLFD